MRHAQKRHLGVGAALLALAGCVSPEQPAPSVAPPLANYSKHGLESVLGGTASMLKAQFGKANLEVEEGDARKLQFVSAICVLDAYLYPPRHGLEPVVTHVDARLPDGRDIDRASCVAALIKREATR